MKVLWKGKEYPEVEEIPAGVIAKIEREIQCDIDEWSKMTGTLAGIFAPVYLVNRNVITWAEVEALSIDQIEACIVLEPGDRKAPLDRKPPAKRTTAKKAAPRASRPSKRRATAPAAAASSTSESTST